MCCEDCCTSVTPAPLPSSTEFQEELNERIGEVIGKLEVRAVRHPDTDERRRALLAAEALKQEVRWA